MASLRCRVHCLAMRKKINFTGLAITGASALFVGLAGNVQAIPISMHNQSNRNQSLATPTASLLSGSVLAQNARARLNSGSSVFYNNRRGASPAIILNGGTTSKTRLTSRAASAANVLDGGPTAMMLAEAFCALALLRKKLKARSGFTTVWGSDLGGGIYSSL